MSEKLFTKIMKQDQETYDEKMLPLIEEEAKTNFKSVLIDAKKQRLTMENESWTEIYENPSDFDINAIADRKLALKALEEKVTVVKEMYKELFEEEI